MAGDVPQELWDEFHRVVNMTSRELREWLRTSSATEAAEVVPDAAGTETGRRVADILGKRPGDLTDEDVRVMREVVDTVRGQRVAGLDTKAGDAAWRHRLMSLGHDPLKPV
ncbi:DUF3140 domain-containing protein [Streptomyces vilmorinianum]|uniref:DUF3140 domain-containing protein n=1 Tax=Streptomyces vilmorinianum TaxID=3051092 RepID=UPI0010FB49B0|nr:DUF3140 domain-containing protein [Streptomyces vilmorinianum]